MKIKNWLIIIITLITSGLAWLLQQAAVRLLARGGATWTTERQVLLLWIHVGIALVLMMLAGLLIVRRLTTSEIFQSVAPVATYLVLLGLASEYFWRKSGALPPFFSYLRAPVHIYGFLEPLLLTMTRATSTVIWILTAMLPFLYVLFGREEKPKSRITTPRA